MPLNLLTDKAPLHVPVGGVFVPIETDFRRGIRCDLLLRDGTLSDRARLWGVLCLFYERQSIPTDIPAAMRAIIWFLRGGESERHTHRALSHAAEGGAPVNKRLFDYQIDSKYIYAAFLDQYGIDLQDIDYLHWWKFRAMFAGLRGDHELMRIMGYRAVNLSAIKNAAERSRMARRQAAYALPPEAAAGDMASRAGALFGAG